VGRRGCARAAQRSLARGIDRTALSHVQGESALLFANPSLPLSLRISLASVLANGACVCLSLAAAVHGRESEHGHLLAIVAARLRSI
jgi:hypothetical protein